MTPEQEERLVRALERLGERGYGGGLVYMGLVLVAIAIFCLGFSVSRLH